MDLLRDLGISLGEFIEGYVMDEVPNTHPPELRRVRLRDALDRSVVRNVFGDDIVSVSALMNELDALVEQPLFGECTHSNMEGMDFAASRDEMVEVAPRWTDLLDRIMANRRSGWESYSGSSTVRSGHAYLVSAVVLRSRSRRRSNYLSKNLGFYLLSSGTKRRVINVLNGLGLCDSYKIINNDASEIASKAQAA